MNNGLKIELEDVKRAAAGRWLSILPVLAPSLERAASKPGKHVPCPLRGGKDGFRFFKDAAVKGAAVSNQDGVFSDGFSVLMWVNNWGFREALEAVAEYLGMLSMSGAIRRALNPIQVQKTPTVSPEDRDRIRQSLRRTFQRSYAIMHPAAEPARLYLAGRGLRFDVLPDDVVRLNPSHGYFDDERTKHGDFPTMVFRVDDAQGQAVTLHRIYLTPHGQKAPVDKPKKLMAYPKEDESRLMGGAIRLARLNGPVMGVAEGPETAMACTLATSIPTWSCVFADAMAAFIPPAGISMVLVWGDKDRSGKGQEAARTLVQRLWSMGIHAVYLIPGVDIPEDQKSVDWLDMWNRYGIQAFPGLDRARSIASRQALGMTAA